ncbi:MAG TPA: YbaB/EbfC family nucleoid-associated protein [Pseudonocardiaceae bacterium]|jgi:DNA-binding protein YbaB|nr:YbaB/EbfC family nucleoid-associated protein [Pseudonocardiaceae bacterium]
MATVIGTDQWLAQYKNKIAGVQQAAAELRENLAAATVTTSSPDGAVTVTIAPNGGLGDLKFSHRAAEHSYAELAALVMKTVAKGQRAVSEKVVEAFEPVGSGTSAMELLTSLAPEEDPEEQAPDNPYDDLAAGAPPAPQPPAPPPAALPPVSIAAPAAAPPRPARPAVDDDEFDERPW